MVAFVGYPETDADLAAMYRSEAKPSLDEFQRHLKRLQLIATEHKVQLVTAGDIREIGAKRKILDAMQQAQMILFVIAHSSGVMIRMPAGEVIEISPQDIESLKLASSPFVVLRVCNGLENGFAQAFMKAGASGVWANRGTISAEVANRQIELFMDQLSRGRSVLDSIQHVNLQEENSRTATTVITELFFLGKTLLAGTEHDRWVYGG
jgi:hypothetical protein